MQNPYQSRFPGAGRLPQANPSDGGSGGIGSDSLGTQFRDWTISPLLVRITDHGTDNAYSWEEVALTDAAGTYDTFPGGLSGTDTAFEVNGSDTVEDGTVVELWPNYGTPGYWSFTVGSGSTPPRAVADSSVHAIAGDDWPDDPLDVFFRRVERVGGVLTEVSPSVEYGGRPRFLGSVSAGSSDGDSVTTGVLDTTGADLIAVVVAWNPTTTADVVVTDSEGNVWTGLTAAVQSDRKVRIFYTLDPTADAAQTFTATASAGTPTIGVAAFANVASFGNETSATTASATSLATGSVAPADRYAVVIAGLAADDSSGDVPTIDDDFTAVVEGQTANHVSGGLAWLIVVDGSAQNPTWSWTTAGNAAAVIASFDTGTVFEHADLPWRCVDPDDGTVTHQIPLFRDVGGTLYAEWDEWYSINTEREFVDVSVVVTQDPVTCIYTTTVTKTYTCHDHIQSFFNTPKLTEIITPTPTTWNCVDGVCTEVTDCGTPGTYATLAECEAACP